MSPGFDGKDSFGRVHRSLRVSVTDRCNLRCTYCMPAGGVLCAPRGELLGFEEILLAVQVACSLGINRIRITGGEPLLRPDLAELVGLLRREAPVEDLALTTNGVLLDRHAEDLAAAGLDRVNVSLDSLRPDRFEAVTRFGVLEQAWRGVEAAAEAGLSPLRINTLLLAGVNDDEVEGWLELSRRHEIDVRFMELMPIGEGAEQTEAGRFVNLTELRERLVEEAGLSPVEKGRGNGPARYYRLPDGKGRVGFITPLSNPYCDTCSRMRLTSTGALRACLAFDDHVSVREALRAGDEEGVREGFLQALREKPAGHQWRAGAVTEAGMSALGG